MPGNHLHLPLPWYNLGPLWEDDHIYHDLSPLSFSSLILLLYQIKQHFIYFHLTSTLLSIRLNNFTLHQHFKDDIFRYYRPHLLSPVIHQFSLHVYRVKENLCTCSPECDSLLKNSLKCYICPEMNSFLNTHCHEMWSQTKKHVVRCTHDTQITAELS